MAIKHFKKENILNFKEFFLGFYDKLPKLLHIKRFVLTLVIVLVFIVVSFWQSFGRLYNYYTVDSPDFGGTYSEGIIGKVDNLNPLFASTNAANSDISALVFAGLTKYNEDREIVPDLAYSWNVSPDGREYTFYLRRAKWHKLNEFVKAKDIVFTMRAIQNPDSRSPLKESWRGVEVKEVDEWTVKFILPGANYSFLELTTVGILPESEFKDMPAKSFGVSKFNMSPIGAGPFEMESIRERQFGQELTLIANNNYYPHPPYLDKITFKVYKERANILRAYSKKDIYGIADLTLEEYEASKNFNNLNYIEMRLPRYVALFFNVKNEPFGDVKVRQAVAAAINKDDLISSSHIIGSRTDYPILSGQLGYSKDTIKINTDLKEAEKLLDAAGWKMEGETRKKEGKALKIEMVTNNSVEFKRVSSYIKDSLKPLGISVNIKDVDLSVLQQEHIKPRRYQVLLIGESIGADPDLYSFWHSTQVQDPGLNLSVFASERLDKNLEAARQTSDLAVKKEKLLIAQKVIQTEVPAVFLYSPSFVYAVNKNFKGVKHVKMSTPTSRFIGIEDWHLKTKRQGKI